MSKHRDAAPDANRVGAKSKRTKRDYAAEARAACEHIVTKDVKPEVQIVNVPVFQPGEIAKFALAVESLAETARELSRMSGELFAMLKRADVLTERKHFPAPVAPPLRRAGAATVLSKGPLRVLKILAANQPATLTQFEIGIIAVWSASTLRTYLPCLRDGGLIEENEGRFTITAAGLKLAA